MADRRWTRPDIEHARRHDGGAADAHSAGPLTPQRRLARRTLRVSVAVSAVAAMALVAAACGGGGSSSKTPKAPATPAATQTPVHAGIVTPLPFTPGANLTDQDLEARGHGQPGRGEFDGEKLIIPSINVDAPFTVKTVPGNGQMPNPNSWNDVVYYDFSNWPGLGGVPGKGGNIVLAGHVDYIHHGPAVFWDLRKLQAGDKVQIQMKDGSVATYEVVFNKFVDADTADFNKITAATAQESVTLVTCTGDFNNGHYNERQIVWAKRV